MLSKILCASISLHVYVRLWPLEKLFSQKKPQSRNHMPAGDTKLTVFYKWTLHSITGASLQNVAVYCSVTGNKYKYGIYKEVAEGHTIFVLDLGERYREIYLPLSLPFERDLVLRHYFYFENLLLRKDFIVKKPCW